MRHYVEATGVLRAMTRYVLPIAILVAGIALIAIAHGHYTSVFADRRSLESAMGVAFILIAFSVWLFNWMMRMSVESGYDREREEDARTYFKRTGRWPDDYV
jgi:lysylphosphatidylglycerol synthetase-like protein (DUF2156 family)